ncbi:MAG: hypothetical protein WC091_25605, partial [Sulfuricellaceae bacterium]
MKLKQFERREAYRFLLTFENGVVKESDLGDLLVLVQFDLFINTLILINKNASMRQGCLHSAHQAAFWSINIC